MAEAQSAIVRQPGEGEQIAALGNDVIVSLAAGETNGSLSIVRYTAGPNFAGPPAHRHGGFDETFYILDGEPTFQAGSDTVRATPGMTVFVPRGAPHAFANLSDAPATFLILFSPGGFEQYFSELANHIREAGGPPDAGFVQHLAQKYGVEMAGPPAWARQS